MSFLDRYEFEQILDEDLASSRNQWQDRVSDSQPQSSPTLKRFKVNIGRTILLGLVAASLGLGLFHQPGFAQKLPSGDRQILTTRQK